jgi:hypothetical protein
MTMLSWLMMLRSQSKIHKTKEELLNCLHHMNPKPSSGRYGYSVSRTSFAKIAGELAVQQLEEDLWRNFVRN